MTEENVPKVLPLYKVLAYLSRSTEPKSVPEISGGINVSYHTVRYNILKLLGLGAVESRGRKYVITEKGKDVLEEFFKEVEELKKSVGRNG
jgi:predicted transcriptional regulator